MKLKYLFLPFIALSLTFVSCGGDDDDTPGSGGGTTVSKNENKNPSSIKDADRLEMPRLVGSDKDIFIIHKTNDGLYNYSMEYNTAALHSRWVAYRYDTKLAAKNYTTRTDAWAPDPALKDYTYAQVDVQTFKEGYQRGHILGSAERYYSKQANEQTFYMSNMSPMIGPFNTTYWGALEDKVRDDWGRPIAAGDTLYVVKGGTTDQVNTRIPVWSTTGSTTYMAVPKYYFIALLKRSSSGSLTSIGFILEHKDYKDTSNKFLSELPRKSAVSIDELEEKTGIDFFCNLPDDVEKIVESSYSLSQWRGL